MGFLSRRKGDDVRQRFSELLSPALSDAVNELNEIRSSYGSFIDRGPGEAAARRVGFKVKERGEAAARQVGIPIEQGGFEAMRAVCEAMGPSRELERAWDGIGRWQA